jgi:hypothetical protein
MIKTQLTALLEQHLKFPESKNLQQRGIADKIEDDTTNVRSISQWYIENNVEITWYVLGILTMSVMDSLIKRQYSAAGFIFVLMVANYLLRKHGFRK